MEDEFHRPLNPGDIIAYPHYGSFRYCLIRSIKDLKINLTYFLRNPYTANQPQKKEQPLIQNTKRCF